MFRRGKLLPFPVNIPRDKGVEVWKCIFLSAERPLINRCMVGNMLKKVLL